jgi:hypothetical protein
VEDGAAEKSTTPKGDWLSAGSHEGHERRQGLTTKVGRQIRGGLS